MGQTQSCMGCSLFLGIWTAKIVSLQVPRAPIPPYILSNVPGTWAFDTMSRRVREEIIGRIYDENDLDAPEMAETKKMMDALKEELTDPANVKITHLCNDGGPDLDTWHQIIEPYKDCSWLDAPWCITEFYLYRRVVAAFGFFRGGPDPFAAQKRAGLLGALGACEAAAARLPPLLPAHRRLAPPPAAAAAAGAAAGAGAAAAGWRDELQLFVSMALWGNKMDLSLWPVDLNAGSSNIKEAFAKIMAQGTEKLLADNSEELLDFICSKETLARVDVVVDNAGFELFTDLCLAHTLLAAGAARKIVFQLKAHPTFVSDAREADMLWMIKTLSGLNKDQYPACQAIGEVWQGLVASGRWELREDFFWCQPNPFWEMPDSLRNDLSENSSLVFVKGDANYRRLLGDRHWPLDTPFSDVCNYFPTKVCALRTLKGEVGCGLPAARVAALRAAEAVVRAEGGRAVGERWMVGGEYGVVQFL